MAQESIFFTVLLEGTADLKNDECIQHRVVQSPGGDVFAVALSKSLHYSVFGGVVCAGHDVRRPAFPTAHCANLRTDLSKQTTYIPRQPEMEYSARHDQQSETHKDYDFFFFFGHTDKISGCSKSK